jgi:hypothetical protein
VENPHTFDLRNFIRRKTPHKTLLPTFRLGTVKGLFVVCDGYMLFIPFHLSLPP